jgi:hypothetical protein
MRRLNVLVIRYIIRYNTTRILKNYPLTDAMINVVDPIPYLLWDFGITLGSGSLREIDPDIVRRNCLRPDEATLTPAGLHFNESDYLCQQCIDEGWREKAALLKGNGKPLRIPILYDDRRRAIIYLRNDVNRQSEGQRSLEPCWVIRCNGEATDISFYEREHRLGIKNGRIKKLQEHKPQNDADFRAEVEAEIKQAEREYHDVRGNLKQPKDGFESRRNDACNAERDQIHAGAALPASVVDIRSASLAPSAPTPFVDESDDEEMIIKGIPRRKRNER